MQSVKFVQLCYVGNYILYALDDQGRVWLRNISLSPNDWQLDGTMPMEAIPPDA